MFGLGIQEIIVIIVIVLLLIDYRKIPEFTRGIGKIYREIKSAQDNIKNEILKSEVTKSSDEPSNDLIKKSINNSDNQDDGSYDGSGRAG